MIGPPGSGKTMLAKRMPTILPPLTFEEALETTKIHSVAGVLDAASGLVGTRPFRSPHHTISDAGMIGGGMIPRQGEVAGAQRCAVSRRVAGIPSKRARSHAPAPGRRQRDHRPGSHVAELPARFMLLAAMNPCPCGYFNDLTRECHCTPMIIELYISKISGPLLDRIDIHIDVPAVNYRELRSTVAPESSADIRT